MKRDWMSTGAEYVERLGKEEVEREIDAMEWQEVPREGSLTVAAMPGYGINEVVRQLRLPKVSAVAISSFDRPGKAGEDGFYPGFYGVEANYKDGRARVYVLDVGSSLCTLVADFFPGERAAHAPGKAVV